MTIPDHHRLPARLALTLAALLGACLPAGVAAADAVAARSSEFGILADLAGSCWSVDTRPASELCYGFDASGRQLSARHYVAGRLQSESTIAAAPERPGWLLETARWLGTDYTLQYHLHLGASNGAIVRDQVRPAHYHDRAELERRSTGRYTESLRKLDADRFEFVQRSERAAGYGPAHAHTITWTLTRARAGA